MISMSTEKKVTVTPQKRTEVLKSALTNSRVRVATSSANQRRGLAASKSRHKSG